MLFHGLDKVTLLERGKNLEEHNNECVISQIIVTIKINIHEVQGSSFLPMIFFIKCPMIPLKQRTQ